MKIMTIKTIEWKNGLIKLIDQTLLPGELRYLYIDNIKDLWQAIKLLKVRGAPALGVSGALGVYLGIRGLKTQEKSRFFAELNKVCRYLASSRPTARNLFWAIERMQGLALENKNKSVLAIKKILFNEALKIMQEDKMSCRKLGYYGSRLIKSGDVILTVCNAGILATIDYGTALGVIYSAQKAGKKLKVFVCETRPLLQGSRLTSWELNKMGIDVTIICDNMAAFLMRSGVIDKVIAGADRISANGDTANKIGTFNLAVLSKFHKIPFYIAAPVSTFDLTLKSGKDIPIEERDSREVTEILFKKRVAPIGAKVFNPAFDVTPHNLITAIITDKGVISKPSQESIAKSIVGRKV